MRDGSGSRALVERLARASDKHLLGDSYSVFTDSVGNMCTTEVAEVQRAFREDFHHDSIFDPHCAPVEDYDDRGNILSVDGGPGAVPVRTWYGGPTKGSKVRLLAAHIRSDTNSSDVRAVTSIKSR